MLTMVCSGASDAAVTCETKAKEQCYDGCEWNLGEDKCSVFGLDAITAMLPVAPSEGSVFHFYASEAAVCNTMSESTCGGDCKWNVDEIKCNPGDSFMMKLACNGTGAETISIMEKCTAIQDEGVCVADSDCQYKAEETKCNIGDQKFAHQVYGKEAGDALMAAVSLNAVCTESASSGCAAEGCSNSLMGCGPDLSKDAETFLDATIACAMMGASCGGDSCQVVGADCTASSAKLQEICSSDDNDDNDDNSNDDVTGDTTETSGGYHPVASASGTLAAALAFSVWAA